MEKKSGISPFRIAYGVFQGMLIGLGAVLPGISGGVLCLVFGIYQPLMELINNPLKTWRKHILKLSPVLIGIVIGFLGVANLLGVVLEAFPAPSASMFVGLIVGLIPSLYREAGEQGRTKGSYIAMAIMFVVVTAAFLPMVLFGEAASDVKLNFGTSLFCGFCVALSIIAPGMSYNTFLMPLGMYTPLTVGIGKLDFAVLIPCAIGAIITVLLLSKAVTKMFSRFHSIAFHGIVGVVLSATIMTVVLEPTFREITSITGWIACGVCFAVGVSAALVLDWFNAKVRAEKE